MPTYNLGNVVGLIKSSTAPAKTYVIWAKILNPLFPNIVEYYIYNGVTAAWELFNGSIKHKGNWNASTNSPTLGNSGAGGVAGDFYTVSVAGSTSIDGISTWKVDDWIFNTGAKWLRVSNDQTVTSVNGQTGAVVLDTDDISEGGTNLYWTSARFNSAFSGKSTDNLSEGATNLYYTAARFNTAFSGKSTSDLAEGSNLYYTDARVRATTLTGLSISGSTISGTDTVLEAFGKLQNQVSAVTGAMNYQGTWNASTNSPSLASGVGTKGYVYRVTTSGSTDLDGITDWKVGDFVVFNGTTYDKWDATDAITAINVTADRITSTGGTSPTLDISSVFEALLLKKDGSVALTADWAAGAYNISSKNFSVNGTAGNGYMELLTQSSVPSAGASNSVRVFSNAGLFSWVRSDGYSRSFASTLTANRTYTLIDSDMTFARIDAAQSFTGVQTFTGQILNSYTSTASTPAIYSTGAIVTGNATTSMPHWFLSASGATASGSWNTAGTAFGINLSAANMFLDFKLNGSSKVIINSNGFAGFGAVAPVAYAALATNGIATSAYYNTGSPTTMEMVNTASYFQYKSNNGSTTFGNFNFGGGGEFTANVASATYSTVTFTQGVNVTTGSNVSKWAQIWSKPGVILGGTTVAGQEWGFLRYEPTITSYTTTLRTFVLDYNPTLTVTPTSHFGIVMRPATVFNSFGAGATPTAMVDIGAGDTTLLPLRLRAWTAANATPTGGVFEYDGTNFFATRITNTRETLLTGLQQTLNALGLAALTQLTNQIKINIAGSDYYVPASAANTPLT